MMKTMNIFGITKPNKDFVTLYFNKDEIPTQLRLIDNVNFEFNTKIYRELTPELIKLIEQIDEIKVNGDKIISKFGVGSLLDISTGCKAVICSKVFKECVININEVGDNYLKYLLVAGNKLYTRRIPDIENLTVKAYDRYFNSYDEILDWRCKNDLKSINL